MEFAKKHYEKILLSLVLLGLAVAVAMLPFKIGKEREVLEQRRKDLTGRPIPYKSLDASGFNATLHKMTNAPAITLAGAHNLFNPVLWQRKADGSMLKIETGREVGPDALAITGISNLHYLVNLDRVSSGSFILSVTREIYRANNRIEPFKLPPRYVSTNSPKLMIGRTDTNEFLVLKQVRGAADNPELVIDLHGVVNETITVAKDRPYKRVAGYMANLKYDLENREFTEVRTNDSIAFGGDEYNVVDISASGIVLLSKSSTRRIPVRYNAAP